MLLRAVRGRGAEAPAKAELPPEVAVLFERLALLVAALPRESIALLGGGPAQLEPLQRAGLLEDTAMGVRLHDVARSLAPRAPTARACAEVGHALAGASDLPSALEGIRLLVAADEMSAAATALVRHGAALFEGGYAPRVWALIERLDDPRLLAVRLRCAAEIGHPEVIDRLVPSGPPPPEVALHWARTLFAVGRVTEALAALDLVPTPDAEVAFEVGMLRSRCLGLMGSPDRDLATTVALTPPSQDPTTLCDAHRPRWLLPVAPPRTHPDAYHTTPTTL